MIRLKKRSEFQRAAKGRRVGTRAFQLQAVRRDDAQNAAPRFGFTVTKRIGNAVVRNRIRRRLREAVRTVRTAGPAEHDFVLVARRAALNRPFELLCADLRDALEKSTRSHPTVTQPKTRNDAGQ